MLTFPTFFTNYSDDKVMDVWRHFPQYFNYILVNFIGRKFRYPGENTDLNVVNFIVQTCTGYVYNMIWNTGFIPPNSENTTSSKKKQITNQEVGIFQLNCQYILCSCIRNINTKLDISNNLNKKLIFIIWTIWY